MAMESERPGPSGGGYLAVKYRFMAPPDRVSLRQASERLGVHYMTAYRYVRTGRLPATLDRATWVVNVADLASFEKGRRPSARPLARRQDGPARPAHLARRMAVGDEAGSWGIIEEALASGSGPADIYTKLLVPALCRIGDAWQSGTMTVADEHRASVVSLRIIGRLGPRFARRGRTRGAVLLGAAPGELHGLPSAILADLLRMAGFGAVDLGPNTPPESFATTALGTPRLLAVLVGATTTGQERALRSVVRALRGAQVHAPVLVGGRGVEDLEEARRLGADGWTGVDAASALAVVEALAGNPGAAASTVVGSGPGPLSSGGRPAPAVPASRTGPGRPARR